MMDCQFCKNYEPAYYTSTPSHDTSTLQPKPDMLVVDYLYKDGYAVVTYKGNSIIIPWPLNEEGRLERLLAWMARGA